MEEARPAPQEWPNDLAHQLAPALREACGGCLSEIRWFRADWQRGGASTGYATFVEDGAPPRDVVVKLPVPPVEHRIITRLAEMAAPTPRVAAHGVELGGYDLVWLVMERLPGDPLSAEAHAEVFEDLAGASAGWYAATREALGAPQAHRAAPDWAGLLETARGALRDNEVPERQRWKEAVKHTQHRLAALVDRWEARPLTDWCHGDLHPGNAMRRPEGSAWGDAACVLLDFAEAHPGHWVEDAVYLERLYWGRSEAMHGAKPVKLMAKARKTRGLDNGDGYAELANVRRTLMAACAPAFLHREGHPLYLGAALDVLERTLPLL